LVRECRVAKERLSGNDRTIIGDVELTRKEFETLISGRVDEIAKLVSMQMSAFHA
jgi:hypothetical protein